jgi:hypothetical protein
MSNFISTLQNRGFVYQATNLEELEKKVSGNKIKAYIGFDCTAKSLHVGSLIQIMMLRWLQKFGHQPIILLGGGTTKIGDPSGKDEARKMLGYNDIEENKKFSHEILTSENLFDEFIYFACEHFRIKHHDFISKKRFRNLVEARQWVCYYFTEYCNRMKLSKPTLGYIGEQIGGKDHATVLHAIGVIQNLLDTDRLKKNEFTKLYNKYLND